MIEIGQVVLEKKMKMWKVYDNNDDNDNNDNNYGQRTNFDQKKITWAFVSGELKTGLPDKSKTLYLPQLVCMGYNLHIICYQIIMR